MTYSRIFGLVLLIMTLIPLLHDPSIAQASEEEENFSIDPMGMDFLTFDLPQAYRSVSITVEVNVRSQLLIAGFNAELWFDYMFGALEPDWTYEGTITSYSRSWRPDSWGEYAIVVQSNERQRVDGRVVFKLKQERASISEYLLLGIGGGICLVLAGLVVMRAYQKNRRESTDPVESTRFCLNCGTAIREASEVCEGCRGLYLPDEYLAEPDWKRKLMNYLLIGTLIVISAIVTLMNPISTLIPLITYLLLLYGIARYQSFQTILGDSQAPIRRKIRQGIFPIALIILFFFIDVVMATNGSKMPLFSLPWLGFICLLILIIVFLVLFYLRECYEEANRKNLRPKPILEGFEGLMELEFEQRGKDFDATIPRYLVDIGAPPITNRNYFRVSTVSTLAIQRIAVIIMLFVLVLGWTFVTMITLDMVFLIYMEQLGDITGYFWMKYLAEVVPVLVVMLIFLDRYEKKYEEERRQQKAVVRPTGLLPNWNDTSVLAHILTRILGNRKERYRAMEYYLFLLFIPITLVPCLVICTLATMLVLATTLDSGMEPTSFHVLTLLTGFLCLLLVLRSLDAWRKSIGMWLEHNVPFDLRLHKSRRVSLHTLSFFPAFIFAFAWAFASLPQFSPNDSIIFFLLSLGLAVFILVGAFVFRTSEVSFYDFHLDGGTAATIANEQASERSLLGRFLVYGLTLLMNSIVIIILGQIYGPETFEFMLLWIIVAFIFILIGLTLAWMTSYTVTMAEADLIDSEKKKLLDQEPQSLIDRLADRFIVPYLARKIED